MWPVSDFAELQNHELRRTDCFLCKPAPEFVIHTADNGFFLAGLGPIVPGYSIVATRDHIDRTVVTNDEEIDSFSKYVEFIRNRLVQEYGSCVVTEHGNMPICGMNEFVHIHCFHPHLLLFPAGPKILSECKEYFGNDGKQFVELKDALKYGRTISHYLLVSETASNFFVFEPVGDLPTQFGRGLIAEAFGVSDLASWRNHPNVTATIENAVSLRKLI